MNRTFTFFFPKKPFLVYVITFLSVFQTMAQTVPTMQASNLAFTNTTSTGTTLNWTSGNGGGRIVFMREGIGSAPVPDNIYFAENKVFGLGGQMGTTGWYTIVKINTDNKTVITGLTPGKTYQAIVMEFNGNPGYPSYLTTTSTGNPAAITTLSNVATLSNLNLSAGALTTVFQSETTDYYARVPNEVSSITVTPVASDANAKIKINGIAVASGTPSQVIGNLEVGSLYANSNLITVEVTAQDGTVKIYRIRVFRLLPQPTIQTTGLTFTNTTSTGTTLNWTNGNGGGRIVFMREGIGSAPVPDNIYFAENKVFGLGDQIGTTGWYTIVKINIDNKTVITGLTPGKTYQAIVMEFNGNPGYPSYLTTTSTGNPAAITTLSNVATLSNLNLSAGALTTVFQSETTDYYARVPNEVSSITVTPVASDANAKIKVNGIAVASGTPSQVIGNLEVGSLYANSNLITVEVTAQDGTVKIYRIRVFRLLPQPTIQTTGLTFTNTTSTGTTLNWTNGNGGSRTVFMRAGTNADSVPNPNPVSELRNGSYQGNPAFGLGDQIGTTGWYVITHINVDNKIIVTGLTPGTTYQVVIMEYTGSSYYPSYLTTTSTGNPAAVTTLSNVATLSNLNLSAGVLTTLFSSETTAYTAKVSSGAGSIKITPITTDNRATIKVNGVAVTSGNPSQEISLATGASTMITIEVTAQDGTVKNYIITVEKSSLGVVDNKIEGFAVYPNPVPQGKLYLQTKLTALKDVKIFDMSGKMVFSVSTTNREVFIEGLQKGVYILKVNQDGAESTEKLIVE